MSELSPDYCEDRHKGLWEQYKNLIVKREKYCHFYRPYNLKILSSTSSHTTVIIENFHELRKKRTDFFQKFVDEIKKTKKN